MLHCALSYLFQQRKEGGGRGLCEKLYEFTQSPARETSFIREDPPCTQFGTVLYSVFCTVLTVVQYLACSRRGGGGKEIIAAAVTKGNFDFGTMFFFAIHRASNRPSRISRLSPLML